MALQDYSKLSAFVDQNYLIQITQISVSTESGQQEVDLLNEGLGGFTPGSGRVRINLGYVVPIGGPEFNFQAAAANGTYHTLQVPLGPLTSAGTGKFTEDEFSQSTNASTEGTCTWVGELKPVE